ADLQFSQVERESEGDAFERKFTEITERTSRIFQETAILDELIEELKKMLLPEELSLRNLEELSTMVKGLFKQINTKDTQKKMKSGELDGKRFREFNKKLKELDKKFRNRQSGQKKLNKQEAAGSRAGGATPTFEDRTLAIQEVAAARFSHSTIAAGTVHGEERLTLDDLKGKIVTNGWDKKAPRLKLYEMPDGRYTSWDNRRLWALKRIVEENATSTLQIPVRVYRCLGKAPTHDIGNLRDGLRNTAKHDSAEATENVRSFRSVLLREEGGCDLSGLDLSSNVHLIFMRIYRDAGKGDARTRCTSIQLSGWDLPVILGYDAVRIRA
ncbi:MAG: hypothetical protein ACE5GN_04760, partial [Waddliaceae bacterium]